ncbi:MAG TPA: spore germination protein GerW family protein [Bryobacteraceae bacterium]|nr:spore germination protein GerW family protein [Bryobacteraceae bacterium]
MGATEMLEKMGGSLASAASVKSVFGEPIHAEGRTVVPVATIAYGFGAGGSRHEGEGGGAGGVRAFPAGVLEITHDSTRFIPYIDIRWLAGAFLAGAVLSRLAFRLRHHRE